MGTTYTVQLGSPLEPDDLRAARTEVARAIGRVEGLMSTYDPNSEISRFARAPANEPFVVSEDTAEVLDRALKVAKSVDGAFDITVLPLVEAWGFGAPGRPDRAPQDDELTAILSRIGPDKIIFDRSERTIRKTVTGVSLDLSAVAKGYAVDRAAEALEARGLSDYLVEVGGETRARGRNSRGRPWRIAVEKPGGGAVALELDARGVASSGNYRNTYVLDGQRYAHTIDPRTGRPVAHPVIGTAVVHEDTALADAWATALMVLGEPQGLDVAAREELAAALFIEGANGLEMKTTPAFDTYVAHPEER